MAEFLHLISPNQARKMLFSNLQSKYYKEDIIPSIDSEGRVVAKDILAPYPLPSFPRSTVDGYAVYSSDTFGASDSLPTYLTTVGEVLMGKNSNIIIKSGQAVLIHTGGMVPNNADAVLMVEDTQLVGANDLEIRKAIAPGENMLGVGEDIAEGSVVIQAGARIRSVEIGGLMALGIMQISVHSKPRVGIISSGDEIVKPDGQMNMGQVRDVNSYMLAKLISKWGGEPILYDIVKDDLKILISIAKRAHKECDIVIFTAGSSVSVRDVTSAAIKSLGKPGVLVHGVNIRPGKPTIVANCSGKPVIGLPGNPVSAYVTANLFIAPLIRHTLGVKSEEFNPTVQGKLTSNIPSQAGREDWIPVKLQSSNNIVEVVPIFSKSNFIFSLVAASGLVCIKSNQTGLEAGELVEVFMCN